MALYLLHENAALFVPAMSMGLKYKILNRPENQQERKTKDGNTHCEVGERGN